MDKKETGGGGFFEGAPESGKPAARMPLTILAQYIKDLSFENPHAPESLRHNDAKGSMDINFGMDVRKIEGEEDNYEVTLAVVAIAKRGDKTAFIAEIEYAVVCHVPKEVPEESIHPMLLIEMPHYAFPFVRQIVANTTQQAGFPPLMLAPVDFRAMYLQRYAQGPQGSKGAAAAKK
jgi:preprotein translocase subunit SecB